MVVDGVHVADRARLGARGGARHAEPLQRRGRVFVLDVPATEVVGSHPSCEPPATDSADPATAETPARARTSRAVTRKTVMKGIIKIAEDRENRVLRVADLLAKQRPAHWGHVNGHIGHPWNEMADSLATYAARQSACTLPSEIVS